MRSSLVEDVLLRLHQTGWIELVRVAAGWPAGPDASAPRLTEDEALAAIRGDGWRSFPPDAAVWFALTDAGEQGPAAETRRVTFTNAARRLVP